MVSVCDCFEVFEQDGNKVAETIFINDRGRKSQDLFEEFHYPILDNISVGEVISPVKTKKRFLDYYLDSIYDYSCFFSYKNVILFPQKGFYITTEQTCTKDLVKGNVETACQYLSLSNWENPQEFNQRDLEQYRASLDLITGEFRNHRRDYKTMDEAIEYWSREYQCYHGQRHNR